MPDRDVGVTRREVEQLEGRRIRRPRGPQPGDYEEGFVGVGFYPTPDTSLAQCPLCRGEGWVDEFQESELVAVKVAACVAAFHDTDTAAAIAARHHFHARVLRAWVLGSVFGAIFGAAAVALAIGGTTWTS